MRYAVINGSLVVNVVALESGANWSPPAGMSLVATDAASVGWTWDGYVFTPPSPPTPPVVTQPIDKYIDIRQPPYNSVLDGVFDCLPAILAAITAASNAGGGGVYIGPGTAHISAPIVWPNGANNVFLMGESLQSSTISIPNNLAGEDSVVYANGLTGIGIERLTINANNTNGLKRSAIWFINCSNFYIRSFAIIKMTYFGIAIDTCTNFSITDGTITKDTALGTHQNNGVLLSGLNVRAFIDHLIVNNTGMLIFGNYIKITNNIISGTKYGGGITTGSSASIRGDYYTVIGNTCLNGYGTDVDGTVVVGYELSGFFATIIGNIAANNGGNGMSCFCDNSIIQGNCCYANGAGGSLPENRSGIVAAYGVNLAGSRGSYNLFSNNQLIGNNGYGYAELGGASLVNNRVIYNIISGSGVGDTHITSGTTTYIAG